MANDHIADDRKKVRLIDADKALEVAKRLYFDPFPIRAVLKTLSYTPSVDAAPVVYAHWEDGCAIRNGKEVYKSIDCSHCDEIFKIESHDREYWKKRFEVCPFCGAKMDGERRTNESEEPV